MNSECAFDHPSAFRLVSKNRSTTIQRCSDVVESRAEHAILDTKTRKNAAFSSVSEQPRRANFRGTARTSDDHSPRRTALSIDPLGDLSIVYRRPQMPAMTLLEWRQSPIQIFTLIYVAQSIDQIRLHSCLISLASDLRSIG